MSTLKLKQCRRLARITCLALCATLLVGCSGDGPKTVPVSGVVKYNGKPLTNGDVKFIPFERENGHGAQGKINEAGEYKLTTFRDGDGCVQGEYHIAVFSYGEAPPPTDAQKELAVVPPSAPPAIPERYFSWRTSKLTAKVGDEAAVVDLELKD